MKHKMKRPFDGYRKKRMRSGVAPGVVYLLLLLLAPLRGVAQGVECQAAGRVVDPRGQPLESVITHLLTAAGDSLVKSEVTGKEGRYAFTRIAPGQYKVIATLMGYKPVASAPFACTAGPAAVADLVLGEMTVNQLGEVTVTAKMPVIEQQVDRVVVNVENSIAAAGNSALEVLQKLPGVTVHADGSIALQGKRGVTVMLNGKPTYLGSADLVNLLANMPGNQVSKVELMTNPPAKYDAAGNAGIINIISPKKDRQGLNGSYNLGLGYGNYHKFNTGVNLYYNTGKVRLSGSYDYANNKGIRKSALNRVVDETGGSTFFDQRSDGTQRKGSNALATGLDYLINRRNTVGVSVSGLWNDTKNNDLSRTFIGDARLAVDSSLRVFNRERLGFNNGNVNLNYRLAMDSSRSELSLDLDASRFTSNGDTYLDNFYYAGEDAPSRSPLYLRSLLAARIDIRSAKLDYGRRVGKTVKLETGFKASRVRTDNDFDFDSYEEGNWVPDRLRTNRFVYDENIVAAYVNVNGKLGPKTEVQAGLRAEYTASKGNSVTLNNVVNRSYANFFPSVFIARTLNDHHTLNLSYSRRIDRPSYQDLNPFLYFNDPYSFQQGNPYLTPQFTDNVSVSHTYKDFLTTSAGVSTTRDVITQVTEQDDLSKVILITSRNLDARRNYSLSVSAPYEWTSWWNSFVYLQGFYQQYVAGEYLGQSLENGQFSVQLYTSQSFTLAENLSAEINVNYLSPSNMGIFRFRSQGGIDLGIRQKIMAGKGDLKLSFNDVLNTRYTRMRTGYGNMDLTLWSRKETRQVRVHFTYRFGHAKARPPRKADPGNEEEKKRVREEK